MDDSPGITRRAFLGGTAKAALLGGLAGAGLLRSAAPQAQASATYQPALVWVWKFSADGPLEPIRDTLAGNGLGIILKTNDGTSWMTDFDRGQPHAVTGPHQVSNLAAIFENAGIPFHAWCVVQGKDPITEARMCSEVAEAGARSIFLDLEPPEGNNYWHGSPESALQFGEEFRRRSPNVWLTLAPDARPWQAPRVPLAEFLSFSNAVAPQSYWATFNSPTNLRYLRDHGYAVGPEGFTPELVVDVSLGTFQHFGLPIHPIGQGASTPDEWQRFVSAAAWRGMAPLSLWRYGTADPGAFGVLATSRPPDLVPPPPEEAPEPMVVAPPAERFTTESITVEQPLMMQDPSAGPWPEPKPLVPLLKPAPQAKRYPQDFKSLPSFRLEDRIKEFLLP